MSDPVSTKNANKGSKGALKTDASAQDLKTKGDDKNNKPVEKPGKTPQTTKASKANLHEEGGFFLTEGKQPAAKPTVKQENVLVSAGLLDGYDYLQRQICKHGFPKGNVFEYAAITMLKYERKLKAKHAEKRLEEKEREKELEKEKAKKQAEIEARGRGSGSPKHIDHGEKSKSPQAKDRSKSPAEEKLKVDEVKTKGKADKSPQPKDEPKGKVDKSPQPKDDKKAGDKKAVSKSPQPKDDGGKADAIKDDKNAKKGGKPEPAKPTAAKK